MEIKFQGDSQVHETRKQRSMIQKLHSPKEEHSGESHNGLELFHHKLFSTPNETDHLISALLQICVSYHIATEVSEIYDLLFLLVIRRTRGMDRFLAAPRGCP